MPAPGTRVAVIGLGGLGHMGVKLAVAMGAEVTVLEPVAEEDGGRPAAGRERVLRDRRPRHLHQARRLFDLILNTVSANLDLAAYLGLLDVDGTLVELGMPEHPMDGPGGPAGLRAAQPGGIDDRRHRRNPGDAGFLRRA